MDKVLQFTDSNFSQEVLQSDKPVLVDFWADWCGPCHMLAPTVKKLAEEFAEYIQVGKLNVDENPLTPAQYGIRGIPTLILYKNGKEAARLVGVHPKHEIANEIKKVLENTVTV